ncbi:dihydrodiol dehydrogenase / D-xylose 2-dehydrogenase (NADP) [Pseudohyphozyma bogoriensis]|nr:dihydrodiol dehydrogenase / D-xylose 2-dehydrogenase (NADP) [Pseudohyphozyma bogoriensis]
MTYTLRWGVISTGRKLLSIATQVSKYSLEDQQFCKESLIDPATRNVSDVKHKVVAVSSRSAQRAEEFIDIWLKNAEGARAKGYGGIEALLKDPDVQAVYIAAPNTYHYEYCKMAILAGKGVLLEKPAAVNAKQAKVLFDLAKKHNVFLMEGAWTHHLPAANKVREIIDSGVLGDIQHVNGAYFIELNINKLAVTDVHLDPAQGGGSLLDVGPYAWYLFHFLVWIYMTLYRHTFGPNPPPGPLPLPKIQSILTPIQYEDPARLSGAIDEATVALFSFPPSSPGKTGKTAMFHTSFSIIPPTGAPCCTVFGSRGKLTIDFPAPRPSKITLETHDIQQGPTVPWIKKDVKIESWEYVMAGGARGFVYEMDDVARCLRDGRTESETVPGRATILSMEIFDTIREQGGLKYSDALEAF